MPKKPASGLLHDKALSSRTLADLKVTGISKPLNVHNKRLVDQATERSSATAKLEDEIDKHQRSLNEVAQSPSFIALQTRTSAVSTIPISSPIALGLIARETRKSMKLSQQEFADFAGVGRRFISEFERGKSSLEFGLVLKVCEAAGITILAKRK